MFDLGNLAVEMLFLVYSVTLILTLQLTLYHSVLCKPQGDCMERAPCAFRPPWPPIPGNIFIGSNFKTLLINNNHVRSQNHWRIEARPRSHMVHHVGLSLWTRHWWAMLWGAVLCSLAQVCIEIPRLKYKSIKTIFLHFFIHLFSY